MAIQFQSLPLIIRDLSRIIRGSIESKDDTLSDIQIEYWINQYRAILIKQDLDKGKYPNPSYIQELNGPNNNGIQLLPVDETEVVGLPIGKYILKSTIKIPKLLDLNYKSGATYIGTLNGREIQLVPQGRIKWQSYKRYTNLDTLAYIKNQYLYISNGDILEYIKMRGIFEIPTDVEVINDPLFDINTFEYPIPHNMLPTLKEMILSKELGIITSKLSDNTNNMNNDLLNEK